MYVFVCLVFGIAMIVVVAILITAVPDHVYHVVLATWTIVAMAATMIVMGRDFTTTDTSSDATMIPIIGSKTCFAPFV